MAECRQVVWKCLKAGVTATRYTLRR